MQVFREDLQSRLFSRACSSLEADPRDTLVTAGLGQLQILPALLVVLCSNGCIRRSDDNVRARQFRRCRAEREYLRARLFCAASSRLIYLTGRQNYELAPMAWALVFFEGIIFGFSVGTFGLYHLYLACKNRCGLNHDRSTCTLC